MPSNKSKAKLSPSKVSVAASQKEQQESPKTVANGLSVLVAHTKRDLGLKKEPPRLSHYRVLPRGLQTTYDLLNKGATLVRATATKYALVGAIDTKDQGNLGSDLLRGCELIAAAAHWTMPDPNGCSRALREHTQKAAFSIFIATLKLVEAFHPDVVAANSSGSSNNKAATIAIATKENNVGAQLTGAVWEACDHILNKLLPQGNRNAMRRELFTWTRECNDTMEEFEEMIELGPKEEATADVEDIRDDDDEDDDDNDFNLGGFGEDDDQYSEAELPIAMACLALLKNSRGNMKIALESCEALGKLEQQEGIENDGDNETHLEAILTIHQHAKNVGEGVTDLGSLLYPTLLPQASEITAGVEKQVTFIVDFQNYLLGLGSDGGRELLSPKVRELANTLRTAAETRQKDFVEALEMCRASSQQQ